MKVRVEDESDSMLQIVFDESAVKALRESEQRFRIATEAVSGVPASKRYGRCGASASVRVSHASGRFEVEAISPSTAGWSSTLSTSTNGPS